MRSGEDDRGEGMDPFGRLVVRRRKLIEEQNGSLQYAGPRPTRFRDCLKRHPHLTHCILSVRVGQSSSSAMASGSLTLSSFLRDSPPSFVTTSDTFDDLGRNLKHRLLVARKEGLGSEGYANALGPALESLYDFVSRSVIQRLNDLKVPEQYYAGFGGVFPSSPPCGGHNWISRPP